MKFLFLIYLFTFLNALAVNAFQQESIKQLVTGAQHSCVVFQSGKVKCWGNNNFGQLGLGDVEVRGDEANEMGARLPYVNLGNNLEVDHLTAGHNHTCAFFRTGQIKCWGANNMGQLGLGDRNPRGKTPEEMGDALPFVDLGTNQQVKKLSSKGNHNCVSFEDGALKCWGWNNFGQLGIGHLSTIGDEPNEMGGALSYTTLGLNEKIREIYTGYQHSCALLESKKIKCWGYAGSGRLGLGDNKSRGDTPDEMGDALPILDLGSGFEIKSLSIAIPSCALTTQGRMKCWGANSYGELGIGDSTSRGTKLTDMGDALAHVDLGFNQEVIEISAGSGGVCAVLANQTAKCWGRNGSGQLGLGDREARGDNPGEMGENLQPIYLGRRQPILHVEVSEEFTCALLGTRTQNAVKCWGRNGLGQLGVGDRRERGAQPSEMGDNLPYVEL
ncbi:MAG: RCC1 domain-containing protein [Bdellovibrionales bacterium]